jgi:hypothetical protein
MDDYDPSEFRLTTQSVAAAWLVVCIWLCAVAVAFWG